MGKRNYLIEGVSCAGKTTVCNELQRRGYHAIHGDRDLAYWGDPETGAPLDRKVYEHWIWDIAKVRALAGDRRRSETFFCGGSRNLRHFAALLDAVFVLEIDVQTLNDRLALRGADDWSGSPGVGEANARLQHSRKEHVPEGAIVINAGAPLDRVVDEILGYVDKPGGKRSA